MREGEHRLEHQHAELTERKTGKVEIYESCAIGFVHDPRIIGREEKVKVFKPRAIRWETSVRFGLEDREREGQQATMKNKSQQEVEGRGRGRCPVGGSALPHKPPNSIPASTHMLRPPVCLHTARLPCSKSGRLTPEPGSFPPPVCRLHPPLPIFRPLRPIPVTHLLEFSTRC